VRFGFLLALLCLIAIPRTLYGQTVTNPSAVEFNSPDHTSTDVTGYELDLKVCTAPGVCGTVIQTITIPKSSVTVVTGTSPVVYHASINVQPITFGSYVGVMRTVAGTVKSADSVPSDPFNRAPGPPSKPTFK